MLTSLIMLEHMGQKCEQGLAVLPPAPSPFAPWRGSEEESVAEQLFFPVCVQNCSLASIPGVPQLSLGMLSTELPFPTTSV